MLHYTVIAFIVPFWVLVVLQQALRLSLRSYLSYF
jgi:hypothetical protein